MDFGDEHGLWWDTPVRESRRGSGPVIEPDISRIMVESEWRGLDVLPDLPYEFALDLEGHDPGIGNKTGSSWAKKGEGEISGVAIATADREFYVPFGHHGGDNTHDQETVLRWVDYHCKRPGSRVIFAHANYDVGWLRRYGVTTPERCDDVQIEAALLDENRFQYGLDSLSKDFLGRSKDEELLRTAASQAGFPNPKSCLHLLPARYVGPYAAMDARNTYDLHQYFKPRLEEEELQYVWDLEIDLIPTVVAMRERGIRVDLDGGERARDKLFAEENRLIEEVRQATGVAITAWDNAAIGRALTTIGIELPKTRMGKDSVTKDLLEHLPGELPGVIRRIRRLSKVRGTFIEGYVLEMQHMGRVHAEFSQLRRTTDEGENSGTVSGRFSSDKPNMQNVPSDAEFGPLVRGLFLPEEGEQWQSSDYAGQEPRWLVHFAAKANCRGAHEAVKAYHANPKMSYHKMTAELTGLDVKKAKAINLGITYGMKGASFCRNNGLPTQWMHIKKQNGRTKWIEVDVGTAMYLREQGEDCVEVAGREGKNMLDQYHRKMPFVTSMIEMATNVAEERGYIKTFSGRRCRFPIDPRTGDRIQTHAALNRLCQGSSADQTKEAIRNSAREGVIPIITLHDENGFSVKSEQEARRNAEIMEHAIEMLVPAVCDVALGDTWGATYEE